MWCVNFLVGPEMVSWDKIKELGFIINIKETNKYKKFS